MRRTVLEMQNQKSNAYMMSSDFHNDIEKEFIMTEVDLSKVSHPNIGDIHRQKQSKQR